MPVENFNVRKTTEHTGVRTKQLVLSDLPTTTATSANLFVDIKTGIVYRLEPEQTEGTGGTGQTVPDEINQ